MSLGDYYLNGTKLIDWNMTLSEGVEVIGEDTRLLDGSLRRDVTARKKNWDLSWEYLTESFDGTYHSYSDLQALGTMSGTMAFIRPTGTTTGTTNTRVFCDPPTAELQVRKDGTHVYWNVSMALKEA